MTMVSSPSLSQGTLHCLVKKGGIINKCRNLIADNRIGTNIPDTLHKRISVFVRNQFICDAKAFLRLPRHKLVQM